MLNTFGMEGFRNTNFNSQMANLTQTQGIAGFDWEALELDGYNKIQRSELSDKYGQTLTSINEREVVEGTVVAITKREVIVNIGYKSEGVIPSSEFRYNPELKVGDKLIKFNLPVPFH